MASTKTLVTFPLFSNFPSEIRNKIWNDALPGEIGPTLYPYSGYCWRPRFVTGRIILEFRHDLLDNIRFKIPLFFVNHDSRSVALAWMHKQGIQLHLHATTSYPIFTRPFNLKSDILNIPYLKWDTFLKEPRFRPFETDLVSTIPRIKRVAIPESIFRDDHHINVILNDYHSVEAVYIIVFMRRDECIASEELDGQGWWEFETRGTGGFFWNAEHRVFEFRDGKPLDDVDLQRILEDESIRMGMMFNPERYTRNFVIRPIFPVKRTE